MVFLGIIFVCYVTLVAMPLALAFAASRLHNAPITIQQTYVKNPRYFSMSFQEKFNQAWSNYDGTGVLELSRQERIIEADKVKLSPLETCDAIVFAQNNDFFPSEGVYFEKEIYIKKNASFENIPVIRAVACKGHLVLGSGTRVVRWADAEGVLAVYDNCDLGISTTSAKRLIIGQNCLFKRLYAPEIRLGVLDLASELDSQLVTVSKPIVSEEIVYGLRYVDGQVANRSKTLRSSIVTQHNLKVLHDFEVQGSIRSAQAITIEDDVIIHGNIFAEGDIYIGKNARIFGVVFSQESIIFDQGVFVGQPGRTKSIVARGDIHFGSGCRVYGYISTEGAGRICPTSSDRR